MKNSLNYVEYVKIWNIVKRVSDAWYAYNIRNKLAKLHTNVVYVLESNNMSRQEKEEKLNVPLRQLSNDIKIQLPIISKKIIEYRKKATDLYQARGEEEKIEITIQILRKIWGDIDFKLSKLTHFNVCGVIINFSELVILGILGFKYFIE